MHLIPYEMIIDSDMFHSGMKHWIAQRYVAPTVSQYMTGACDKCIPSSASKEHIHCNSHDVFATDLYSASVDDRATPFGFFDCQEIGC